MGVVDVNSGYELKGAYNGMGEKVPLQKDNDGNWYVIVPTQRGRQWQPTPVLLPGEFHGRRSLVGHSPWGH